MRGNKSPLFQAGQLTVDVAGMSSPEEANRSFKALSQVIARGLLASEKCQKSVA
nr:hypothetical protein [Ktedonobacter racemifer]